MKDYDKRISNYNCEKILEYYLSLEKGEMQTISLICENTGFSKYTIRCFINSLDKEKDVNDEFSNLYKLVLTHTIFIKNEKEGSNYSNQQEYFKKLEEKKLKRKRAKTIALSLYKRQQTEKGN